MSAAETSYRERLRRAGLLTGTPTVVPRYDGPSAPPGDARAARYAQAALDSEAEAVATAPEGTRNHTLNKAAWKLGQLVEAGHLDGQQVIDTLTIAAGRAGLSLSEIARTAPRAVHQGRATPRIVPPPREPLAHVFTLDPTAVPPGEADDDSLTAAIDERFPRLDWQALWADDSEEEWIVEPLLGVGRSVALYSSPKVGKSLLMLELAAGVASGRDVLGEQVVRRRVLYVDFENDPRGDIRTRLQAMGYEPDDLDDLVVLSYPTMSALDSPAGGAELLAVAARWQAQVIVIDTLSRAVQGEENANDTYLAFYRHTVLRAKQAGIAMIRLDHAGKDAEKGMRGASAKEGDVDAVWRLTRIDDDQLSLECTHHRMPLAETDLLLIRESLPHLRHRLDTSGHRTAREAKIAETLAALDHLGVPDDASERVARTALRGTGVVVRNSTLREALRRHRGSISMLEQNRWGTR